MIKSNIAAVVRRNFVAGDNSVVFGAGDHAINEGSIRFDLILMDKNVKADGEIEFGQGLRKDISSDIVPFWIIPPVLFYDDRG
jgi:hypothetical protein